MCTQFVMSHQLLGDLFGERGIKSASLVNCRQFLVLAFVVCSESVRSRASSASSVPACEWT
jgi:hypothetical protein